MEISRYFASFGIRVDPKEVQKVDNQLKAIDRRIRIWNARWRNQAPVRLSRFTVDRAALRTNLSAALDVASGQVTFEIRRFHVNRAALRAALGGALDRSGAGMNLGGPAAAGLGAAGGMLATRTRQSGHSGLGMHPHALVGGAMGYGVFRLLGGINKLNQEVVSAGLTTKAVANIAGYSDKQGAESLKWLQDQGNRIGFDWLDNVPSYNTFMSNAMGSGMNMEEGQHVFQGFSEYGRAMGISKARNKLVMSALGQMAGKGTLSMEELRRQMAESMPGTFPVFAEAYQQLLASKGEGGNLTGQEAFEKLVTDVSAGNVNSAEILPIVASLMKEKAAHKLKQASQTAQADQARFENALTSVSMLVSPQIESATGRFFKTLTTGLQESGDLAQVLAGGVDNLSRVFRTTAGVAQEIVGGWGMIFETMGVSKGYGFGLAAVGTSLLFPFTRVLTVLAAISMVLEDIIATARGAEDTFFFKFGEKFLEMKDDVSTKTSGFMVSSARRVATERLKDPDNLTPEQIRHYEAVQRMPHISDFYKPGLKTTPENILYARQLVAEGELNKEDLPWHMQGAMTMNAAQLEKLTNEVYTQRGLNPAMLGERLHANLPPSSSSTARGRMEINMNVTGQTTEEAIGNMKDPRFQIMIQDVFEEALSGALSQFPANSN